jgi:hydroxymethylpyrimidine/phosphomethylpyrimidine kinase
MNDPRPVCALAIAGSDSGGGAGLQADIRTFAAHGVHGLTVVTAVTAQNTRGVTAIGVIPTDLIRAQIDACFADFRIGAVKLGMLADAGVIHAVADCLGRYRPSNIVIDPVMVATSGARLLADEAIVALRERLLPLATVLTPNIPEAEALLGRRIESGDDALAALFTLIDQGVPAVLLKGGHLAEGDEVIDRFSDGLTRATYLHPRLAVTAHGTGCTLSSAIAAQLCLGQPLGRACELAGDFVFEALLAGYRPGSSELLVLDHLARLRSSVGAPSSTPDNKKAGD